MLFEHRSFSVAKDAASPETNQDAQAADPLRGIAAIADGASSSLFAGPWARLLVESIVAEPPEVDSAASFPAWLAKQRESWRSGIDADKLAWHQKPKLADGAFATLLWIEVVPSLSGQTAHLTAHAVGDCCLFHLHNLRVKRVFPLERSELFGNEPAMLGSGDRQKPGDLSFDVLSDTCEPGDMLVLASDAVAVWALKRLESGASLGLESLWEMTQEDFARWIGRLRDEQQIRFDDSTVMLLRMQSADTERAAESDGVTSRVGNWFRGRG